MHFIGMVNVATRAYKDKVKDAQQFRERDIVDISMPNHIHPPPLV